MKGMKKIMRPQISKMQRREDFWGWLFITPILIWLCFSSVFPTLYCFAISFTDYNMLAWDNKITKFTLDAYKDVFTSQGYWNAMYNTVYYLIGLPIRIFSGFLIACGMNYKKLRGRKFFHIVYYLPGVSSGVAVAFVWRYFFNPDGVLNAILGTNIAWLYDPDWIKPSLIIKGVWGGIGGTALMYYAAMKNINQELYESADLDGAGTLTKMFKITLPLLKTITIYNVMMGIAGGLNAFSDNFTMISGDSANTVVYWIYQQFLGGNYPLVGAGAVILSIFTILFSVPQYKKIVRDN